MLASRTIPINRVTSAPAAEPVTATDVKLNAYVVEDTTWDDFITDQLIPTARNYVERLANRSLITQTRRQYYDTLPDEFYLRYPPVITVSAITYMDTAGDSQTLTGSLYTVDAVSYPGRIYPAYQQTWPSAASDTNSCYVTYTAGYGATGASVPIIYRRAIILLCTHWFNNRAAFACGEADEATQAALESMLAIEGATLEYA